MVEATNGIPPRCGQRYALHAIAERWMGIGVVTAYGAPELMVPWPRVTRDETRP